MSAQQPKIEPWITDAARRVKQYPVAGLHGVEQIITEAYAAHLASGETKATDFPAILERERTLVAEGVTNIKKAIQCREWLTEGRGSYEWNDDRWHSEFAAAIAEIITALQPLERIAADWTNCPQTWEKVREARKELLGKPWNSASVPASEAPSAATPDIRCDHCGALMTKGPCDVSTIHVKPCICAARASSTSASAQAAVDGEGNTLLDGDMG